VTQSIDVGRLFVAAPLPESFRRELAAHVRRHTGGAGLPGRVVPVDNWHLTLRFLGDTSRDAHDRLVAALAAADMGASFDLELGALGAFPRPERARVLWIGAGEGRERLVALAAIAESAAVAAGFAPERRPFSAHLTLSRLKPERDVSPIVAAVSPFGSRTAIDEIVLYRSHLRREGAEYEALRRFPLARRVPQPE